MNKKDTVKIIGICGPARAGKNTLARIITKLLIDTDSDTYSNYIIATESFAAPIKSMVAMLLDFFGYGSIMNPASLLPYLEGDKKEETLEAVGVDISPRTLMQTLGTDWGRDMIDEDIWLNSMEERIKQYALAKDHGHNGAVVIITDVRFDNEAEMIKHYGGTIVQITTTRQLDDVTDHVTERGVSDCMIDAKIENNGDIEQLGYLATVYLEGLLGETIAGGAPRIIKVPPDGEGTNEAN